jgi:hypothetical protein
MTTYLLDDKLRMLWCVLAPWQVKFKLFPPDGPRVNVSGIEGLVAVMGYHSDAVVQWMKRYEVRTIFQRSTRTTVQLTGQGWLTEGSVPESRQVRGSYGNSMSGEMAEHSFTHRDERMAYGVAT